MVDQRILVLPSASSFYADQGIQIRERWSKILLLTLCLLPLSCAAPLHEEAPTPAPVTHRESGYSLAGVIVSPPEITASSAKTPVTIELFNSNPTAVRVGISLISARLNVSFYCPGVLRAQTGCVLTAIPVSAPSDPETGLLLTVSGQSLSIILKPDPNAQFDFNTPFTLTRSRRPVREMNGRYLLKNAGLYTQIERRGWASEYWTGQLVQQWDQFDPIVGKTVAQEASLQLDAMRAMGVNTITLELRAGDATSGPYSPPNCFVPSVLGVNWPQPTPTELANLPKLFDMADSKGMKVWLRLVNNHMEETPPTNSTTWLGAIFGVIKNHPALDLFLFEGDAHLIISHDNGPLDTCGGLAEPPLYLGPNNYASNYIAWAITYGMLQGLPVRKLSAEAIVGSYVTESGSGAGSNATDRHLWSSIAVMKSIFDNLNIPADQRTYAISMYEQQKCASVGTVPCTPKDPHPWAEETFTYVRTVTGNSSRIVAPEMGNLDPVSPSWPETRAMESLIFLMNKYNVDGGAYWRWTSFSDSEVNDPGQPKTVKVRGINFTYYPVQKEIVDMGGFHLLAVPNASFETSQNQPGVPDNWTISGTGAGTSYVLTQENGQPELPSRGNIALRLITGSNSNDAVSATSAILPATREITYTTTANLRFSFSGDPNPNGNPASRPNVFLTVKYFQSNGSPSAVRTQDVFRLFQENSTGSGFATFPFVYTAPYDAYFAQLTYGAQRNGLSTAITLDVDNVR